MTGQGVEVKVYTGTLQGPEGTTVGRFVKFEVAHNLQQQIDYLREVLSMVAQAATFGEATGLAKDGIEGHDASIAAHTGRLNG